MSKSQIYNYCGHEILLLDSHAFFWKQYENIFVGKQSSQVMFANKAFTAEFSRMSRELTFFG